MHYSMKNIKTFTDIFSINIFHALISIFYQYIKMIFYYVILLVILAICSKIETFKEFLFDLDKVL